MAAFSIVAPTPAKPHNYSTIDTNTTPLLVYPRKAEERADPKTFLKKFPNLRRMRYIIAEF